MQIFNIKKFNARFTNCLLHQLLHLKICLLAVERNRQIHHPLL